VKAVLSAAARADLADAIRYYEAQEPGLGLRFLDDIQSALTRIEAFPYAWSLFSARSRRYLLARFPYGLLYEVRPDTVRIIAVGHQHRGPGYRKSRTR
jgi:plasmid stabilization system protein ParE